MERLEDLWHEHKESNWLIITLLILFFPVGLYLMWRYSGWNRLPKLIVTAIISLIIFTNMGEEDSGDPIIDDPDEVHAEAESATATEEKDVEEEEKEDEEKQNKEEAEKVAAEERKEEEAEEKRKEEEAEKEAQEEQERKEAEKEAEEERKKEEEEEKRKEEEAEKETEEQEKQEELDEETEEDLTPEEEIEAAVREDPKAVITDLIVTTDGTEALVSVTFEGRDNLTLGFIKTGIHDSMTRILFSLKELDYDFIEITLMAELPLVDQYGNEESSVVMRGHYDSNVLNQINPDNKYIVQDNLQNIAIEWYEHPAIQD